MVRTTRSKKRAHVSDDEAPDLGSHSFSFSLADLDAAPEDELVPAYIHRVSEDRRRNYTERLDVEPPSPVKRNRLATRHPTEGASIPFGPTTGDDFQSFNLNSERYQLGSLDDDDPPRAPSPPLRLPRAVKPSVCFPCFNQREAKLMGA
jgi:hypothetical protein